MFIHFIDPIKNKNLCYTNLNCEDAMLNVVQNSSISLELLSTVVKILCKSRGFLVGHEDERLNSFPAPLRVPLLTGIYGWNQRNSNAGSGRRDLSRRKRASSRERPASFAQLLVVPPSSATGAGMSDVETNVYLSEDVLATGTEARCYCTLNLRFPMPTRHSALAKTKIIIAMKS